MKIIRLFGFLLLLAALGTGISLWAQNPTGRPDLKVIYDTITSVRQFQQVAISPDGVRLAWVQDDKIYVRDIQPGSAQHVISAANGRAASEGEVAWSPDSRHLAFLSDAAKSGQAQLYVAEAGGGAVRKLTSLTGFLTSPRWSPDGRTVALLFIENSPRKAGPLVPMTPDSGVVEEHIYEQRIATVDVRSGTLRQASPADMYVYEYDWSSDGKQFAAIAAHGSGDNNWWIAQLYTMPSSGGPMRSIHKPSLQMAVPRWSPDGKTIAFISGLMSDQAVTGGDVWTVSSAGGDARNLTPQMPASASWLAWNGQRILFAEDVKGSAGISTVDLTGKLESLWRQPETISGSTDVYGMSLSLATDGKRSAVIRQSFARPPEVWAGETGKWAQMTSVNAGVKPLWGDGKSAVWTSDGVEVQGWLLYPYGFDPSKRYPLIVHIHGGPAGACTAAWPGLATGSMAAAGYLVLCPNPRGSFGQGESFTQANVKDFGGGDLRDIMGGVHEVLNDPKTIVDKDRIGIKGHSYGGYMAMWAVTQTNEFKAAVAGAGLSNWLSYYGQNDIDQWMIPYFGASVYDDPAVYAKSSPINFVKKVKTPTLILVGDRDGEVPAPQSYEWWHALKTLGVPTRLIVYPNEGHMISQAEHQRDVMVQTIEWFDRWMPPVRNSSASAE